MPYFKFTDFTSYIMKNKRRHHDEEDLSSMDTISRSPTYVKESELVLLKLLNKFESTSNIPDYESFQKYSYWYIQYIYHQIGRYVEYQNQKELDTESSSEEDIVILPSIYPENNDLNTKIFQSLNKLCEALQTRNSSIQDIALLLGGTKTLLSEPTTKSAYCHHIFTMISWVTMLYSTGMKKPLGRLQLSLKDSTNPKKNLRSESWERLYCNITADVITQPFPRLLRYFGDFTPPKMAKTQRNIHRSFLSDSLIASNLSYYIICKVGHLRIEWVDSISLHLEFDERTSVVKLFRYPSFCAMLCLGRDSRSTIFSDIFCHTSNGPFFNNGDDDDSNNPEHYTTNSDPYSQDFFMEVLCSYRLLFGQHQLARKEFSKMAKKFKNNDNFKDPLWEQLCSLPPDKISLYSEIDAPRVKSLYSASADFPFLGKRLLLLHEYLDTQNPKDLRTLWYDRRDINRFYTFWAVFFLGGISILLSLTQIILAALAL